MAAESPTISAVITVGSHSSQLHTVAITGGVAAAKIPDFVSGDVGSNQEPAPTTTTTRGHEPVAVGLRKPPELPGPPPGP